MRILILVIALFPFVLSVARADWEGKFHVEKSSDPDHESKGVIHYKDDRFRAELDPASQTPLLSVLILDVKTGKVQSLMPAQKLAMEMDLAKAPIQVPLCRAADYKTCLAKNGFKLARTETLQKHACSVYRGKTQGRGGEKPLTLWHPNDLPEVLFLKAISGDPGHLTTIEIQDVRAGAQAEALFGLPPDYRMLGNISNLLQNLGQPSK